MGSLRFSFLLFAFVLGSTVGCGSGSAPKAVADQDELQKWVAENPVTEAPDPSLIGGAVK